MNVAIDLGANPAPVFYNYIMEALLELAGSRAHDSFIFYNCCEPPSRLPPNVSTTDSAPSKVSRLASLFTNRNKKEGEIFIQCFQPGEEVVAGSILILPDLSVLLHVEFFEKKEVALFRKQIAKAVSRASAIVVPSLYYKQWLQWQFHVPENKLHLLGIYSPAVVDPLSWDEKMKIQETYAGGREFFLFAGDLHKRFDMITLLKAFSGFKKWQKSNMQLVIAGFDTTEVAIEGEILSKYKYKNDVRIHRNPSKQVMQQLMAAAYAFVYPARYDCFPLPVLQALHSHLPVITADLPEIREIAGDAAVYALLTEQSISMLMQKIYKEEGWRNEVIQQASQHLRHTMQQNELHFPDVLPSSSLLG